MQEREQKKAEKQRRLDQRNNSGSKRLNASSHSQRAAKRQLEDNCPESGIQHREISEDECAVCFGLHEEDPEQVEWLRCTNEDCNVWSHTDCLENCDGVYVCYACGTLLM